MNTAKRIISVILILLFGTLVLSCSSDSISDGEDLYERFLMFEPNDPGNFEMEYVDGELVSTCLVGGKYKAYYGWVSLADTFIAGRPVNDTNPSKFYLFFIDLNGQWKMNKAGEANKNDLFQTVNKAGCEAS